MSGSASKTDPLGLYIRASLDRRRARMLRELARCRWQFSEAAVHDLRVSLRRLISTLDLAAAVLDDPTLRNIRRDLKRTFSSLGALRDVQVQLLLLAPLATRHPSVRPLQTVLKVKEQRLVVRLMRRLERATPAEHAILFRSLKAKVSKAFRSRVAARARGAAVIATVTAVFARAVQLKEMVDPARPATIHRLRIAFKKFRYKVEMLESLLPSVTKAQLRAMDAYQTRMGTIHDLEVFTDTLHAFAVRPSARRRVMPPGIARELAARRTELLRLFREGAGDLYGFWRIPPGDPYAAIDAWRKARRNALRRRRS